MPSPFSVNIGQKMRRPRRMSEMRRYADTSSEIEAAKKDLKESARVWQRYIEEYQDSVVEAENRLIQERLDIQKKESSVLAGLRRVGEWLQSAFSREQLVEEKHEQLIAKSEAIAVAGEQLEALDELSKEFFDEGDKRYGSSDTLVPVSESQEESKQQVEQDTMVPEETAGVPVKYVEQDTMVPVIDAPDTLVPMTVHEAETIPVDQDTVLYKESNSDDITLPPAQVLPASELPTANRSFAAAMAEAQAINDVSVEKQAANNEGMTIAQARQDIIAELEEIAAGSNDSEENVIDFDEAASGMMEMIPEQIKGLRITRGAIDSITLAIEALQTQMEEDGDSLDGYTADTPIAERHQRWDALSTLHHYKSRMEAIQRSIERRPVKSLIEQWAIPAVAEAAEGLKKEMNIILVAEGDPRFAVEASLAQYIADRLDVLAGHFQSMEIEGLTFDERATESIVEPATEEIDGRREEVKHHRNASLEYQRKNRAAAMQAILEVTQIKDKAKRQEAAQELIGQSIMLKKNEWYTISDYIASGGMGAVFEVTDKEGNTFAMKMGRPYDRDLLNSTSSDAFIARSQLREIATLKKLNPSNDPASPFVGYKTAHHMRREQNGVVEVMPVTVMERIQGETLHKTLRQGVAPEQALSFITDVCGAVQQMHDAGISHRDIKAGNIMVVDGRAKIIDMGTANIVEKDKTQRERQGIPTAGDAIHPSYWMEQSDKVVGTISYMPPFEVDSQYTSAMQKAFEQGDQNAIDQFLANTGKRRDLYSLGQLLRRYSGSFPKSYGAVIDYVSKRLIVENSYPDEVQNPMTAAEAMQMLQDPSQLNTTEYLQIIAQYRAAEEYRNRIDTARSTSTGRSKKAAA